MTLTINPHTYTEIRTLTGWQDQLDSICSDAVTSAMQIQDAVVADTVTMSEDAEKDAIALIRATGLVVDAMMAFHKRYARG